MKYFITSLLLTVSFHLAGQKLILTEIMYNSPGEDLEFLEFLNNGTDTLNLEGYQITDGVEYTFPEVHLAPDEFFVVTNDSITFERAFAYRSYIAHEWDSGTLVNGGELIRVTDAQDNIVLGVEYDDIAPWPHLADGLGPSITFCDLNGSTDDPANWQTNYAGTLVPLTQGGKMYANPFNHRACRDSFEFWLLAPNRTIEIERDIIIEIPVFYENTEEEGIQVTVVVTSASQATEGEDFVMINDTLDFAPGQTAPEFITVQILDDLQEEDREYIGFHLHKDGSRYINTPLISMNILDNDSELEKGIELRGILETASLKALELYAKPNLELDTPINYGIGSANNGGGSDSIEHVLRVPLPEDGLCFYVTNDTVEIKNFLGPIDNEVLYLIDDLDFNGNDAVELYENGRLIDLFGRVDENGEGTAWDYTDGWARKISVGNNTSFDESNWIFSGPGVLEDVETNDASTNPYPLDCLASGISPVDQDSGSVKVFPNPASESITIIADEKIEKINLIDMMGREIYASCQIAPVQIIRLPEQVKGVFLLVIEMAGKQEIKKIVVE